MALKKLNRANAPSTHKYPVKVIQFGEGNFLRAFVDWIVDTMNEEAGFNAGVQIIQPLAQGMGEMLNGQEGLYHLVLQGIKNGEPSKEAKLIDCVNGVINPYQDFNAYLKSAEGDDVRFIVSNTTESGIVFSPADITPDTLPQSFPGKLTVWLYHRFQTFNGDVTKGVILLPCELIEKNGEALRQTIVQYIDHWNLNGKFREWILNHNIFCNTLVDRIVPGFPKENIGEIQQEIGYEDQLVVTAEPFHLWVIEGPAQVAKELPAGKTDLQVVFADDLTPYRSRKVRILNGAHTAMVPVAYLKGLRTVREVMEDAETSKFVSETIASEIIPTLDLPDSELRQFAYDVAERFLNPFIKHELSSIALNSISKFEVRVLPSIVTYYKRKQKLPANLIKSFAALLVFYRGTWKNETLPVSDAEEVVAGFKAAWATNDPNKVVDHIAQLGKSYREAFTEIPTLKSALEEGLQLYLKSEKEAIKLTI